jgi:hypothetical protein
LVATASKSNDGEVRGAAASAIEALQDEAKDVGVLFAITGHRFKE